MASRAGQIELRNGGGSDALTHGVLERRFAQGATTDLPQSPENRRLGGPRVRISFPPGESRVRTCMLAGMDQTGESQISLTDPPTVGVSSATGDHAVGWRLRQGKAALTAGSAIYAQEPLSDRRRPDFGWAERRGPQDRAIDDFTLKGISAQNTNQSVSMIWPDEDERAARIGGAGAGDHRQRPRLHRRGDRDRDIRVAGRRGVADFGTPSQAVTFGELLDAYEAGRVTWKSSWPPV